ncbi:heme peroxidase [Phlyctochytrium arcticum]|nr:heme peroxidase [Phlyctochytrium arcticum]
MPSVTSSVSSSTLKMVKELKLKSPVSMPMDAELPIIQKPQLSGPVGNLIEKSSLLKMATESLMDLTAVSKFLQMGLSEQKEIIQIIAEGALGFGDKIVIDDRQFPFERLMQMLACLPADSTVRNHMSETFITTFWNDLDRPPRVWPGKPFREADGSWNSFKYPHMGMSNTSYARTVTSMSLLLPGDLPDPERLFDDLMCRPNDEFVPHPTKVNTLLFYLAGVITHDLFRSDPENPAINKTTHYADLSPLYGVNADEQRKVRGEGGKIKPDSFADPRLQFQIPGIVAMLVLFSRHHNYLVDELLAHDADENYRFTLSDGKGSLPLESAVSDELLFQTARLINNQTYANIILHEYLRTILGLPATTNFTLNPLMTPPAPDPTAGNVCSVEFGFVYRWHSSLGQKDAEWLKQLNVASVYEQTKQHITEMKAYKAAAAAKGETPDPSEAAKASGAFFGKLMELFGYKMSELQLGPICLGLHRDPKTKRFVDSDMINVLQNGIKEIASSMGARKVPKEMRQIEVDGIKNARRLGCCTLNEFRKKFHLQTYETFEDMNPDPKIVAQLKKYYNKVDDVELYPGLVIEEAKHDGLSLPYTASRAILADAVNLLRNDRFMVDGLNPRDLTVWGYNYIMGEGSTSKSGSLFKGMVEKCFPTWNRVVGRGAEDMLINPFVTYSA